MCKVLQSWTFYIFIGFQFCEVSDFPIFQISDFVLFHVSDFTIFPVFKSLVFVIFWKVFSLTWDLSFKPFFETLFHQGQLTVSVSLPPPRGLIRGSMTLARYFLVFRELEMGCSLCAEVEATEATKLGQNILNFAGAPPPHFCSATSNFKGHQISWSTFFGKNCFCSFLQIHAASSFSRLCFIEKYAVRENRWCEESTGSVNGVTFKSFFQNHLWFDHFCHLCFDNKELSWAWGSDLFVHEWFSL